MKLSYTGEIIITIKIIIIDFAPLGQLQCMYFVVLFLRQRLVINLYILFMAATYMSLIDI